MVNFNLGKWNEKDVNSVCHEHLCLEHPTTVWKVIGSTPIGASTLMTNLINIFLIFYQVSNYSFIGNIIILLLWKC